MSLVPCPCPACDGSLVSKYERRTHLNTFVLALSKLADFHVEASIKADAPKYNVFGAENSSVQEGEPHEQVRYAREKVRE